MFGLYCLCADKGDVVDLTTEDDEIQRAIALSLHHSVSLEGLRILCPLGFV